MCDVCGGVVDLVEFYVVVGFCGLFCDVVWVVFGCWYCGGVDFFD